MKNAGSILMLQKKHLFANILEVTLILNPCKQIKGLLKGHKLWLLHTEQKGYLNENIVLLPGKQMEFE